MLLLENAVCTYGKVAFEFTLNLPKGKTMAVIGASGSGKTTLLNAIAGFLPLKSGQIHWNGTDLTLLPPNQRPMTMLFQEYNLFPHLNCYENVAIGVNPSLKLAKQEKEMVYAALERVGLGEKYDAYPDMLSGGQRQRIALARALVRRSEILLLDEPFSGLDPNIRIEMLDLLKNIQKEQSLTLLFTTHQTSDAEAISHYTAFIEDRMVRYLDETVLLLTPPYRRPIAHYLGYKNYQES